MHSPYSDKYLQALCQDLQYKHHTFIQTQAPELLAQTRVLSQQMPEIMADISERLNKLFALIETHMQKEALLVYPYCQKLKDINASFASFGGSIAESLENMEAEHQDYLKQIAELESRVFQVQHTSDVAFASFGWRHKISTLLSTLKVLILKEERFLFPQTLIMERHYISNL